MSYYPQQMINQIKFSSSSPLLVTSYALISLTNFMLVSSHIFSTSSSITNGMEVGLFVGALATTAINMMILLYIKSRKMPSQGVSMTPLPMKRRINFMPIVFTILQLILMSLLIGLFMLSDTSLDTTTKVFMISSIVILNIGTILMVWSFSSIHCGPYNQMMQQGMLNQSYGTPYSQMGYSQQYQQY